MSSDGTLVDPHHTLAVTDEWSAESTTPVPSSSPQVHWREDVLTYRSSAPPSAAPASTASAVILRCTSVLEESSPPAPPASPAPSPVLPAEEFAATHRARLLDEMSELEAMLRELELPHPSIVPLPPLPVPVAGEVYRPVMSELTFITEQREEIQRLATIDTGAGLSIIGWQRCRDLGVRPRPCRPHRPSAIAGVTAAHARIVAEAVVNIKVGATVYPWVFGVLEGSGSAAVDDTLIVGRELLHHYSARVVMDRTRSFYSYLRWRHNPVTVPVFPLAATDAGILRTTADCTIPPRSHCRVRTSLHRSHQPDSPLEPCYLVEGVNQGGPQHALFSHGAVVSPQLTRPCSPVPEQPTAKCVETALFLVISNFSALPLSVRAGTCIATAQPAPLHPDNRPVELPCVDPLSALPTALPAGWESMAPGVFVIQSIGEDGTPTVVHDAATHSAREEEDEEHREEDPGDSIPAAAELRQVVEEKVRRECPHLAMTERQELVSLLLQYPSLFAGALGQASGAFHTIDTDSALPLRRRMYNYSPAQHAEITRQVEALLKQGVIQLSSSPWASNVVLVRKKDGSWRFAIDYRALNSVTKSDVYPLPTVDDTLEKLGGARYYSTMDLLSGYWQVPLKPGDREKTAFLTQHGLYEWLRMPMGLKNSGSSFQRLMNVVLGDLIGNGVLVYLDDVIAYGATWAEHAATLATVFQRLSAAGLTCKLKKCIFAQPTVEFLGHSVSAEGIGTAEHILAKIRQCQPPRNRVGSAHS